MPVGPLCFHGSQIQGETMFKMSQTQLSQLDKLHDKQKQLVECFGTSNTRFLTQQLEGLQQMKEQLGRSSMMEQDCLRERSWQWGCRNACNGFLQVHHCVLLVCQQGITRGRLVTWPPHGAQQRSRLRTLFRWWRASCASQLA